jgi:hypothetical protein
MDFARVWSASPVSRPVHGTVDWAAGTHLQHHILDLERRLHGVPVDQNPPFVVLASLLLLLVLDLALLLLAAEPPCQRYKDE